MKSCFARWNPSELFCNSMLGWNLRLSPQMKWNPPLLTRRSRISSRSDFIPHKWDFFRHRRISLKKAHIVLVDKCVLFSGGERGIRTLGTGLPHTRFPVVRLRPAQPSLHADSNIIPQLLGFVKCFFAFFAKKFLIRFFFLLPPHNSLPLHSLPHRVLACFLFFFAPFRHLSTIFPIFSQVLTNKKPLYHKFFSK